MSDWHFVNLVVPVLLPLALLGMLALFPLSARTQSRSSILLAIKDGQMAWAGLGMCMSALYELRHAPRSFRLTAAVSDSLFWLLLTDLLLLTVIAALAPIFPVRVMRLPDFGSTLKHYRVLIASIVLTLFAAGCYSAIHASV